MSTGRETLASNFAAARANGLLDIKFFAFGGGDTTVESLREAAIKADKAIADNHVVDFVVNDKDMVADSLDELLYS